jgi:hypothetical protein
LWTLTRHIDRFKIMTNQQPTPILKDGEYEQLRMLYEVTISDIAFFKQQQISVTNYGIALHAAVVVIAFQFLPKPVANWEMQFLRILILIVSIMCYIFLKQLNYSISVRRERLKKIRSYFSEVFFNAWDEKKKKDSIFRLLVFIVAIGLALSWYLLGHVT